MKFFLLIFLSVMLKMQLAGAPMTDEQISARIKASSESPMDEDSATALKIWEETLAVSKATAQAVAAEQKSRDDLDKLSRLAVLAAPGAPPESTPLIDQVGLSEKVSVLLESTQIRIRATTIQQFNNRELLVPNKEFITSQLVNWTLKDSVLRFEIPVGIAYGSDTKKAASVLQKILSEHPDVMDEPKPDVLFVNFGNSTLDFNVRGFVASVEHFVTAKSDLHYLIDDAFREAGIEIAFPQQDLHIRSLPEGGFNKLPS